MQLAALGLTRSRISPPNTTPRFGLGAANAWSVSPEELLSSMVTIPGASHGGRSGSFTLTTSPGNYGWIAVLASITESGLRVFDGLGFGGWNGAGLAGNNTGASPDPCVSTVVYTDVHGVQWRLFRQDFVDTNPTPAPYTIS